VRWLRAPVLALIAFGYVAKTPMLPLIGAPTSKINWTLLYPDSLRLRKNPVANL